MRCPRYMRHAKGGSGKCALHPLLSSAMFRSMQPIVSIKNLSKTYASGFQALCGIDLDIRQGEIFALLGPNGAGKTTLIGIVTATSGSVTVSGHDIVADYRAARSLIGLVPQELSTDAFESVLATVSFSRGLFGKPKDPALVERVLRDLSLWDRKDSRIMTLSGGMKRRLMIARALVNEPKFLILDEPTAGVDVELRRGMWDYLTGLSKSGLTILLTTHYLEEAEQLCKHVAIINKGEIVAQGGMEEILQKHGSDEAKKEGYRGGRLEEVFLKLTSEKTV